jgi:hypothetical protein
MDTNENAYIESRVNDHGTRPPLRSREAVVAFDDSLDMFINGSRLRAAAGRACDAHAPCAPPPTITPLIPNVECGERPSISCDSIELARVTPPPPRLTSLRDEIVVCASVTPPPQVLRDKVSWNDVYFTFTNRCRPAVNHVVHQWIYLVVIRMRLFRAIRASPTWRLCPAHPSTVG